MGQSQVAYRYAKSILELAKDAGQTDAVAADMNTLAGTITESADLKAVLKSPVINAAQKIGVLKSIFDGKVSNVTINLMETVVNNKRESQLAEIAHSYLNQLNDLQNVVEAEITTAVPLTQELQMKAMEVIKSMSDKQIKLVEKIDKSIIGGIIVKIGDKQVDQSVRRRLQNFQKELTKNIYTSVN